MRAVSGLLALCLVAVTLGGCGSSENDITIGTFTIMPGVTGTTATAYNSASDQYLVVARAGDNIYGRVVGANGAPTGSRTTVVTDANMNGGPAVAHDATRNRYLVIWTTGGAGAKLAGQFVQPSGAPSGPQFPIESSGSPAEADLAYNAASDSYLVCWRDDAVKARVVPGDGTVEASFELGGSAGSVAPRVAANNPLAGEFLVVWHDAAGGVFGEIVPAGGGPGTLINISAETASSHDVAYAPGADTYLAVWTDARSGNLNVYGQVVNADGSLSGSCQVISDYPRGEDEIILTFCPHNSRHLALWYVVDRLAGRTLDAAGANPSSQYTVDVWTSGESVAASTAASVALVAYARSGDIRGRLIEVPTG